MEIKLQGMYGLQNAIYAKDLKIGDIAVWNYGCEEQVLEIDYTKSGKSMKIKILCVDSGKILVRTLRINKLVCVK